jgi:hypothetical protein
MEEEIVGFKRSQEIDSQGAGCALTKSERGSGIRRSHAAGTGSHRQ